MTNITPFLPLGQIEAQNRLVQFVDYYKPLAKTLPYVSSFEENIWDLRGHYFQASSGNQRLNINFFALSDDGQKSREPLLLPYLDFAKAFSLHLMATNNWKSHASLEKPWLQLLRYVEFELRSAYPDIPPCVTFLTPEICESINASIRNSKLAEQTKYTICMALNSFIDSIQRLGLCCKRFTWSGLTIPPEKKHLKVGPVGDRAREDMLPSLDAIGAIAYCFAHAEGPREQWVSAINGLLAGQPARLGECWFLREEFAVNLNLLGQERFGLRWWPQKKAKPLVKEFLADDPFVPVFRQCFQWLIEISEPARKIAQWYEDNPGRMYLPIELEKFRNKEFLTISEAASIRGIQAKTFLRRRCWAYNKGIRPALNPVSGEMGIRFADLESAVLSDLPHGFPWFDKSRNLKYSQMILLIREDEFKSTSPTSTTMFQVPADRVYYRALDDMVDRHGLVEADGSPVRIRSHQFRHKNETVEYTAGVQRKWANWHAGRARTSQEEAYDDRTDAQKVAQASVVSVHQSVFGEMVLREPNRPKTHAEIMAEVDLAKRTGYVHVTDKGCCVHSFVDKPCSEFRDCLFCKDHICVKGVPLWDRNIRAEIAAEEDNLSHAMEAAEKGRYGVKEHIEELILPRVTFCRQVKTLLDNPLIPSGTEFGHAPKADPYDPVLNAMRHHIELGHKKGQDVAWVERALERLQHINTACAERPFLKDGDQA